MNAPVLQVESLHKSYGALQATNNVSLDVRPGEIHALIGPNGAGKTTLVHQIYGSESSDSGTIRLHGTVVNGLAVPQRVRLGIGRSFQISNVLMGFRCWRMPSSPNRRAAARRSVFSGQPSPILT